MVNTPKISIIICTYNRAEVFSETLASFTQMDFSNAGKFELVIVNNNSNDNTAEIATSFCTDHPFARYLFEERPGLSQARNKGILESRGQVIVFIDDDVFLDANWLNAVARVFADQPGAAAFGGKSIPQFEGGRPPWLEEPMNCIYGDTGLGDVPCWMEFPSIPFGLNMGFRRGVFDQIGLFNPKLGRIKGSLLSNEELDIFWRIAQAGLKVYYAPDALLFHRIPANRIDPNWVVERYYWQGVSDVLFEQSIRPHSRTTLLVQGIRNVWGALHAMRGGHISPRRIRWHYKGIPVAHAADFWGKLGTGWQQIKTAIDLR